MWGLMALLALLTLGGAVLAQTVAPSPKWIVLVPPPHQLSDLAQAHTLLSSLLDAEPEWRAVVVCGGGNEASASQTHSRATILSAQDPALRDFKVKTAVSKEGNNMHRMLGYLFAIKHGAKIIFDGELNTTHAPRALDRLSAPGGAFAFFDTSLNPYAYFGQPSIWPTGLPVDVAVALGNITSNPPSVLSPLIGNDHTGPRIRQALYDGQPDLDPLTTRALHRDLDVTFATRRVTPVLYGEASTPLASAGALFFHDAFWALPLPAGPNAVLRGLWAKRVLAEMLPGPLAGISYHAPLGRRRGTAHHGGAGRAAAVVRELAAAARVAENVEATHELLRHWQPAPSASGAARTVQDIALMLARDLMREWDDDEHADVVAAFYEDLASVGYVFPALPYTPSDATTSVGPGLTTSIQVRLTVSGAAKSTRELLTKEHEVLQKNVDRYWAGLARRGNTIASLDETAPHVATVTTRWSDAIVPGPSNTWEPTLTDFSFDESPEQVLPVCRGPHLPVPVSHPKILFVVNFHWNKQVESNAARILLDNVFSHYYNTPFDVVFVGPGSSRNGVLGNGVGENGYKSWVSMTAAAKQYPNYDGYFLVNDDMVVVQSQFEPHAFSWRWQYPFTVGSQYLACRTGKNWAFNNYCPMLIAAFNEMCAGQFRADCGGREGIYFGPGDGWYVPRSLIAEWTKWSDVMLKHDCYLEMVVPTIINAIMPTLPCTPPPTYSSEGPMPPTAVPVCTLWGEGRANYHDHLVSDAAEDFRSCVAFHPIKVTKDPAIAERVRAHLVTRANKECRVGACKGSFTQDPDGMLWKWNNA
eukprot:m.36595 g.36595  ORF g.36595 m.36595 type:complete len:813 (-) comp9698_c2_seq1:120-2558(-)